MSKAHSDSTLNSNNSDNNYDSAILQNRYLLKDPLGSGGFGTVYKIFDILLKVMLALKLPLKDERDDSNFKNEEKILKKVNESNINTCVKYYDSGIGSLTINGRLIKIKYIIMELAREENLFDKLFKTSNGFSEDVCKYILSEITKCTKDLHKIGICHRDIKPENIVFVGDKYDIKLCDLGLADYFKNDNNEKILLKKSVGTNPYKAPELIMNNFYDGEKIDVFSIGVTIFNLMTKKIPFQKCNNILELKGSLYNYIMTNQINTYWQKLETDENINLKILSPEFKKLFINMVKYDPENRINLDEIINSDWMRDIKYASEEYLKSLRTKMISEITI